MYGENSLLLPFAKALCNADNYKYAVQGISYGLSAEDVVQSGNEKGKNITPAPPGVKSCF
jgi:hypothetical protein